MYFHEQTNYILPITLDFLNNKAALTEVLTALEIPENVQKLAAAKENSGNEMLRTMQFVFPIVLQIQMEVIKKYGFPDGREGIY